MTSPSSYFPAQFDLSNGPVNQVATSQTDPRVVYDGQGLRATDAGGHLLLDLNANGTARFTGEIDLTAPVDPALNPMGTSAVKWLRNADGKVLGRAYGGQDRSLAVGSASTVITAENPDDLGGIGLTPKRLAQLRLRASGTGEAAGGNEIFAEVMNDAGTVTITKKVLGSDGSSDFFPVGMILPYGGSAAPSAEWFICDGRAVSRTTYATLFNVLSTRFGVGDGSTTFNIPDLRGKTVIGAGQGSGLTNRVAGASGGEENHQLSVAEIPAHNHPPSGGRANFLVDGAGSVNFVTGSQYNVIATTGNAGGGGSHNNMQPFTVVQYIIRAV